MNNTTNGGSQPAMIPPKMQLISNGMYVFMGDVSMDTMSPIIDWILSENMKRSDRQKELTLGICSRGGDLNACFALVDVLRASTIPVKTVGLGMIASCGLLLFISGQKGKRILTPNTAILSHQYSWGSVGKEHELFARVKEMELTTERMINHYKKCTGMNEKKVREFLLPPEDVWLSAEEAKSLKLCDKIEDIQ
jgi:ATP-dependent Clp protease protease subunit|tara:strand:- start:1896 stop:2477 length:582 start_codon:yes stop_codon:yes gene_type:complete